MVSQTVSRTVLVLSLLGIASASARAVLDTRISLYPAEQSNAVQARVARDLHAWKANPTCARPLLRDFAEGYFTQNKQKETLYLVQDCLQNPDVPDGLDPVSWKLAIYRGGVLRQVLSRVGQQIGNIGDINRDGLDDLVFLAGDGRGKDGATFLTLAGGKLHRFLDMDVAYVYNCSAKGFGNITGYRVDVEAARTPKFTIQEFKTRGDDCESELKDYQLIRSWKVTGIARP